MPRREVLQGACKKAQNFIILGPFKVMRKKKIPSLLRMGLTTSILLVLIVVTLQLSAGQDCN